MTGWQEILGIAVVGTERQEVPVSRAGGELGRALARLDVSDREGALLGAAALAALYRLAGFRPATDARPLPEACATDETNCCNAEAGQHLLLMLEGEFKEALPEWLAALAAARRRVPEEYLPALLDKGRAERGLRPLIVNVMGRRGRWLAAQRDEWRWAVAAQSERDAWETGGRDERLFILRALRATDPAGARELLASTWKAEAARDRQAFLETLAVGLSGDDESFLNEALQDRSTEVRRTAGDLLLRLPSSQLRRHVSERVASLLVYKKPLLGKASIEVALPADPGKWQKENQIHLELPAARPALGEKGWWLLNAVGWVPPSTWCAAWGRKPVEVLAAALKSEWKEALVAGLVTAAARYADADWAEAILSHEEVRAQNMQEVNVLLQGLALVIPAERLEALILKELSKEREAIHAGHPALRLLHGHRRAWGDKLSRAVAASVKERMKSGGKGESVEWQLGPALKSFALYVAPELCDELAALWPADANMWWRNTFDDFQSLLRFRRDMLRAVTREEGV